MCPCEVLTTAHVAWELGAPSLLGYRGGRSGESPGRSVAPSLRPFRPDRTHDATRSTAPTATSYNSFWTIGVPVVGTSPPLCTWSDLPGKCNTPGFALNPGVDAGGVGEVVFVAYAAEVVTSTASGEPDEISTLRGLARSAIGIWSVRTPWS